MNAERVATVVDEAAVALFDTLSWVIFTALLLAVSPIWLPLFIWRRRTSSLAGGGTK